MSEWKATLQVQKKKYESKKTGEKKEYIMVWFAIPEEIRKKLNLEGGETVKIRRIRGKVFEFEIV